MEKVKSKFPFTVNRSLCKACGICMELCPKKVFTKNKANEPRVTYPENCTKCNLCFYRCPDFAIQLQEVKSYE